jgi:hypothetical protein
LGLKIERVPVAAAMNAQDAAMPDDAPPELVQASLVAAMKAYAKRFEDGEHFAPFTAEHGVTATEVVLLASNLLKAADIELFELAMWKISTGD